MSTLQDLLTKNIFPIKDAIYFNDDTAIELSLFWEPQLKLETGKKFNLKDFLNENPDWVTSIDITNEVAIPTDDGYFLLAEGSYGSEGVIIFLDKTKKPKWAIYLEESNPFKSIEFIKNDNVSINSTAGITITLDPQSPLKISIAHTQNT
ncbi:MULTISPECIES: hypothetical protein [Chromobacterium]|uniref:Uncharacterized protein n=1 Tax=Chromobacterium phragmitis TaxID=2202141 RepID=A0ABV0IS15_9NEIS|nr:hypothetical protein [Chromobacterium violaceum]